jgi:hypothetical protein
MVPALQSLPHTPANISYHLIHLILVLISVRLSNNGWRLHLTVATPHQVVRYKSFLATANQNLILATPHVTTCLIIFISLNHASNLLVNQILSKTNGNSN